MKRQGTIVVGAAILLGFLLLTGSGTALAAESSWTDWKEKLPFRLTGEVEVGGQIVQPRGNSPTFDEYRDLDRTDRGGEGHIPQVPSLHLLGEDRARTGFVEIGGTNLTRMDANYYMNAGLYNYLRFNFEFDRIQKVIAHNARTIYDEPSPGLFTISDPAKRAALATALNAVVAPITQAQRDAVESAVDNLLRPVKLAFQTDAARFGFGWLPLPDLEVSAGYSLTTREGRVPGGFVIGSPGSNVMELSIPRDERIHEVKASAEYARDWYQVRFNYTFSMFENDVNKIERDNPCGAGAGGCRNPSGLGRVSTPPDNFAHTFSGAGGIMLPWWQTRLTGAASYSLWRQDDTFLPWTTNAGAGNTDSAGASSPDARMNIVLANLNLTSRPLRDVTTTTRYRYYELENHTPEHTFTKVLNPGDLTPSQADTNIHSSEPLAFRRQNASQEIAWRIIPQVTAKAGYEWEHWNRSHREVDSSNEHTFKGTVDVRPWRWLLGRLSYAHGVRTIHANGYEPLGGNADVLPQFRKFDEADRTRDRGDVLLQLSPLQSLTVTGTFTITHDNFFNSVYGLQDARSFGASADINWMPVEAVNLFVGYAHDNYASQIQKRFITGVVINDPTDDYTVRPLDMLDTVTAGANLVMIPKRLDLDVGYSFSFGRSKMSALGAPGGQAAGEPTVFPTVKNAQHVLNATARWYLTPQWTLKLGYQYERYWEVDFTTDGESPSLANFPGTISAGDVRSIVLGSHHPAYEAHIVAFSAAYKF